MTTTEGRKNPPQRTNAKALNARERELKALELRMGGQSYSQIAKAVGYKSRSSAHDAVMRILDRRVNEPTERVRTLELQRLEKLLSAYWSKATRKRNPDTNAAKLCLDIMARRARMLGLDAPMKVDITDLVRELAITAGVDPNAALQEAYQVVKSAKYEA